MNIVETLVEKLIARPKIAMAFAAVGTAICSYAIYQAGGSPSVRTFAIGGTGAAVAGWCAGAAFTWFNDETARRHFPGRHHVVSGGVTILEP